MHIRTWIVIGLATLAILAPFSSAADALSGRVVDVEMESQALAGNLIGLETRRRIKVYLPPGYQRGARRYPVVYYIHNMNWNPEKLFAENRLPEYFERAAKRRRMGEVILVAGDFTTPTGFNFFGNDRVAGRWTDLIVRELVPYVDTHFRTLATPASRGLAGDFFGAHATLRVAMHHPGVFGAAYALHPVGTGTGLQPGRWRPDWRRVHEARDWDELRRDTYAPVFVSMAQAYLPNPDRPPFFCDFMVEPQNGVLAPHTANTIKLVSGFLLDQQLLAHAESLKQLRALKLDWGRYDATFGHVYANQAFVRKLEEFGVPHVAEEYSGNEWNRLWGPQGRVELDVVPFFAASLEGAAASFP